MHGFIGRLYFSFSGIFPVGWGQHTYEEFSIKQARFCFIETKTRILKVYVYISGYSGKKHSAFPRNVPTQTVNTKWGWSKDLKCRFEAPTCFIFCNPGLGQWDHYFYLNNPNKPLLFQTGLGKASPPIVSPEREIVKRGPALIQKRTVI